MNLRQAAQQALEALEKATRFMSDSDYKKLNQAIDDLRAALSEPEQQPVAWMCPDDPDRATAFAWRYGYCIDCGKPRIPVYTAHNITGETK